jgi:hypothetical protein
MEAPQDPISSSLMGISDLACHEHALTLPSHLILSHPREAEAELPHTGIGERKQVQSFAKPYIWREKRYVKAYWHAEE